MNHLEEPEELVKWRRRQWWAWVALEVAFILGFTGVIVAILRGWGSIEVLAEGDRAVLGSAVPFFPGSLARLSPAEAEVQGVRAGGWVQLLRTRRGLDRGCAPEVAGARCVPALLRSVRLASGRGLRKAPQRGVFRR